MASDDPEGSATEYPGWVRRRRLGAFVVMTTLCAIGMGLSWWSAWFVLFVIPFALFGYIAVILALGSYRLGVRGGDAQGAIHRLIIERLDAGPRASVLDVGCGAGRRAIGIAKATAADVVGVDTWGASWEYSKELCDRNARAEGVADRISFERGTGARLGGAHGRFDAVVSCMTFHEVRDAEPRVDAVVEALRVLRTGGRFIFVDPFADTAYYPSIEAVAAAVRGAGAEVTELAPVRSLVALPFPLRHPKVLGRTVLLAGRKLPKES